MQFSLKENFIKNRVSSILLLIGGFLFIIAYFLNTEYVMSSNLRLLKYISLVLISTSIFMILIKRKKVILGNIILFILMFILIELLCFFMLGMPDALNKDFSLPLMPKEHISTHLGTVAYSDSVYHEVLIKDNDTVYDVLNSIDENNLRITPGHKLENKEYALFFGCSIAFGTGLNDDQTFPYHFQENSKKYNSYNYAYPGYGTNHMLARMEYQDLSKDVVEKNGKAFYIFFWDHINRSIGAMSHYTEWVSNAPFYTFKDNELIRNKKFKDGRYTISKAYELIYQLNIIKKFDIGFPVELNEKHYDLVSEIILKSKETYKKQFGNSEFYVVFYPNYMKYTNAQLKEFKTYLTKKDIEYIDLNKVIKYGSEHTLGGDPHPNSNTNQLISKELLNRINKLN